MDFQNEKDDTVNLVLDKIVGDIVYSHYKKHSTARARNVLRVEFLCHIFSNREHPSPARATRRHFYACAIA